MKFSTKAIHAGQQPDPATGATIVPIYQTATFTQSGIGENMGFEYSRVNNPTRTALETCIASLENGEYGLAVASGMAAEAAVCSLLRPGDHVVASEDLYGGTHGLFENHLSQMGVSFTFVSGNDPECFRDAAQTNTVFVWLESPTNPLLNMLDIRAIAAQFAGTGIFVVVDNTFATPLLQRPLELGADVVVHSTTKYIGGHSDVVGGAVITNSRDIYKGLKFYQITGGAIPGPFDSWLTMRGLKTLELRMRHHCKNALAVAKFLEGHAQVERVIYPGLASHPDHALAMRQMDGMGGGIVTFYIKGGRVEADRFFRRLKVFSFAVSLGGVESIAGYPPTMSHSAYSLDIRSALGITDNIIRLSVGIEDDGDLIDDLRQALEG